MSKPVIFGITPEILAREGLTDQIARWEDGRRMENAPGVFEWWYFDAHFDDQTTAVIVFTTKPLLERTGPLKPGLSLAITLPNGAQLGQFPFCPPAQFSAAKETCDVRLGPNWVRGDLHRYELHVELEGLAADLVFTGAVPPWRPGAGKAFFGDLDHYFAWLPAIPYGTVTGTLTYNGQTHQVKGTGYHDHNWGNIGLDQVMDHWYWGRAHIGEYTLIYVEQIAAQTYNYTHMPVFMLAKGEQIITGDSTPFTLTTADFVKPPNGRAYPQKVDFHWQVGDETIHLRLRQPKLIEGVSLLITFPAWQRWLLRLLANPYYFRFNAELELTINLKDLQATERGLALYEIMILQGRKHP